MRIDVSTHEELERLAVEPAVLVTAQRILDAAPSVVHASPCQHLRAGSPTAPARRDPRFDSPAPVAGE